MGPLLNNFGPVGIFNVALPRGSRCYLRQIFAERFSDPVREKSATDTSTDALPA
jgi:hypothetical protein